MHSVSDMSAATDVHVCERGVVTELTCGLSSRWLGGSRFASSYSLCARAHPGERLPLLSRIRAPPAAVALEAMLYWQADGVVVELVDCSSKV